MAITQDGLSLDHLEQTRLLLGAGVKWIQLRMKGASAEERLETAKGFAGLCREAHAVSIVNDDVSAALSSGADGVHLGSTDLNWAYARQYLGADRIIGGTVNHLGDATRARASGVLDYVGVGPWRFTSNKKNLAPVLGQAGVAPLVAFLAPLPVWVIGGIEESDTEAVHATGAAGLAVSSSLFRGAEVADNVRRFARAWAEVAKSESSHNL